MKSDSMLRFGSAAYFGLTGLLLIAVVFLAAPRFWFFACACLYTLTAIAWAWRPHVAAALSVGPLLGLASLFRYCDGRCYWTLAIVLVIAGGLLVYALRRKGERTTSIYLIVVSLAVVSLAFGVDRKFTNVMTVSKYEMEWSINAEAPWGEVGPAIEDGQPVVILYRRVADSFCYDAIYSSELRKHLAEQSKRYVTVEYNRFSDFGREGRYDIRSVDGLLINEREWRGRDTAKISWISSLGIFDRCSTRTRGISALLRKLIGTVM